MVLQIPEVTLSSGLGPKITRNIGSHKLKDWVRCSPTVIKKIKNFNEKHPFMLRKNSE